MSDIAAADIGGTKVLAGIVDAFGRVKVREEIATDDPIGSLIRALGMVIEREPVDAIGAAVAAYVEHGSGRAVFAPNLDLVDPDIRGALLDRFGLPVIIENDASAAAWAEHRFGAGKDRGDVVMLTVGTGVGGGAVLAGSLHRGARGFAGEFGHMIISSDGPPCACGQTGCLEALASGTAIERMASERQAAGWDRRGQLDGSAVADAASEGDPVAIQILEEAGRALGVGIWNLVSAFDPQVVVVGGGVGEGAPMVIDSAAAELDRRCAGRRPAPDVVAALLGNDAGMVGAADLARSALEGG